MKLAIGSDHGGLKYKNLIIEHLINKGHVVSDAGTFEETSCDYPIFGFKVAEQVANGDAQLGVLICTSGEGIMMAANKVKGVRCALGYNDEVTILSRQHNNANIISFGEKFMDIEDVLRRVDLFIETDFEGGRHARRVNLIDEYK